ncbi:DUF5723 family protein [Crocinitomicaceae bacterium]|nr:DUF5723 family protein [Crocinitomicaceae bacterium]
MPLLICLYYSGVLNAQTQGASYTEVGRGVATTFVTDYHSLGINCSALGIPNRYNKKFTTGMTELNLGLYSDSLSVDRLKSLYGAIRDQISGKEIPKSTWQEQKNNAQDYALSGLSIDASYNWFGWAYQGKRFGGLAVIISEHYSWYSRLNQMTSDIVFQGKLSSYFDSLSIVFGTDTSMIQNSGSISQDTLNNVIEGTVSLPLNLSELTKGSNIKFSWNRHYNFGYGRKVFGKDSVFSIYAGVGGRFIQSMAMVDLISDNNGVRMNTSISPAFNINYGSIANLNPSSFYQTSGIPIPVGTGYGVDFSASIKMLGVLNLALAVNNLGAVKYKRNVYRVRDTLVTGMTLSGLDDLNITNSLNPLLEEGGFLSLEGKESYTVKNASNFRFGASLDLGRIASLGFDFVAPFNSDTPGSIINPIYSFGMDLNIFKWLTLSAGYFGGGIYKDNIPVGVNFIFGGGTYEFGISSRDAITFFLNDSNSISTASGFARIRF